MCHTCARILDEQASGGALRGFFFLGLCGLLAVIAVRAILADYLFLGLGLLAAGPIAWAIGESMRRKAIADRVMGEDSAPALIHTSSNVAPLHQHAQDAPFEALRECFQSGDFQSIASSIQENESLTDWCHRTASAFPSDVGIATEDVYRLLISAVQNNKPRPRVPVADWFDATQKRIQEIAVNAATLDLSSPASGRQAGETNSAWLSRVGPLFLNVRDGESKDDAIETLVEIASKTPPQDGESLRAWFERVKIHIDEHNASLS